MRDGRHGRWLPAIGACLVAVLAFTAPALAGAGDLDPTFSGDGKVMAPPAGIALAEAIDSQGRIVVAGGTAEGAFSVVRYTSHGQLDSSFGGNGIAAISFHGPYLDFASSVAIDSKGRIVVAGATGDGSGDADFAVARFKPDGSPDISFDGDGKTTTSFNGAGGGNGDQALGVTTDAQDRIIAAGIAGDNSEDRHGDSALARYRVGGKLDDSFDGDGRVTLGIGNGAAGVGRDRFSAVAMDAQGRIVAAGAANDQDGGLTNYDFSVARFTATGSPDGSFSGGHVTTPMEPGFEDEFAHALAIDGSGRIVVAGQADFGHQCPCQFATARYEPDGDLDVTFSGDGKAYLFQSTDGATGVAIDSLGRIVVAGNAAGENPNSDFAVARYKDTGALDPAFSSDGKVTTELRENDYGHAVAIDSRDRIVVAGESVFFNPTAHFVVSLTRYFGDSTPPTTTITAGPSGKTTDRTPTFKFHADEKPVQFECAVDDGSYVPCTSPHTLDRLKLGWHVFRVRATDQAGNVGRPARREFKVIR
jgi:uncharacterized delta-60 repeat protein